MSEPETAPKPGLKPLRALLPYLRPYRRLAVGWLTFLALSSVATLTLPWAVGQMIDHGFSGADPSAIDRSFLGLFIVAGVLAIATSLRFWFISMLGESVVADLRRRLYAHLLTLDTAFFERSRSGELLSRITADAELVQTVIGSSVSVALRSVVMLVGASALLQPAEVVGKLGLVTFPIGIGRVHVGVVERAQHQARACQQQREAVERVDAPVRKDRPVPERDVALPVEHHARHHAAAQCDRSRPPARPA